MTGEIFLEGALIVTIAILILSFLLIVDPLGAKAKIV